MDAAPGPDGIHPFLIKTFKHQLLEPLFILYTKSIDDGVCPKEWKSMIITPVKKQGKAMSKPKSFLASGLDFTPGQGNRDSYKRRDPNILGGKQNAL